MPCKSWWRAGAGVDTQLTLVSEEKLAVLVNTFADSHLAGEIADAILDLLLGDKQHDRPAPNVSNQAASVKESGLPGKLLGTWTGFVLTYKHDLPVTLWFKESGDVHAQLGELTSSKS